MKALVFKGPGPRLAGGEHRIHALRESLHERLLELTDGHGPDVVIEAVGRPETFRAAVEEVAFTGRVVYIGMQKSRYHMKLGGSYKRNSTF